MRLLLSGVACCRWMKAVVTIKYEIGEKICESGGTFVCRGHRLAGGKPAVLKILRPEAASEEAKARFRREFGTLSKIGLPGAVKAYGLEDYQGGLMMALEDIGGQSLDRMAGRALPLAQLIPLATGLADTLEGLHGLGIVHGAINPSHIVFNPEDGQFRLTGFGFAGEPLKTEALSGKLLAYISPEQTGRMNRAVDYRTDFYSLGATLYELLSGRPPFEGEEALAMVHCHIAKMPAAPATLDPAIPAAISNIVMKLLAKAPEDRYQSGAGLKADLERCLEALAEGGAVPSFELGLADLPGHLRAPPTLYGRGKETARLFEAFERASAGACELMLVAGYAGVGKTALVHELTGAIRDSGGYFIEGKFGQLQRNAPYSGWLRAFEGFVSSLLMGSDADLARYKQRILSAVQNSGRVLTDVIRNLNLIIGPQPPIAELGGAEAENRFNYIFLEFIKAVADQEHPLVVFLDDLQWADAASLRLLNYVLTASGVSGLLIAGAYRDNEVDATHPLSKALGELEHTRAAVERLSLAPLSQDDIGAWLAGCLTADRSYTETLAGPLYAMTAGNPFYILQILRAFESEGVLTYDRGLRRWQWDAKAIGTMSVPSDVVDLILQRLRRFPQSTQNILQVAACLGASFDAATLSAASGEPFDAVLAGLAPGYRGAVRRCFGKGMPVCARPRATGRLSSHPH